MRRQSLSRVCVTIALALSATGIASAQDQESLREFATRPVGVDQAPVQARAEKEQAPSTPGSTQRRGRRRSSRQRSLNVTANLVGGYDDNVGATLTSGSTAVPVVATNGSSAFGDAMLEYSRSNSSHGITVRTLGSLQMYPGYLDTPAGAAKARVRGYARIGVKNTVRYSTQLRYEPLFSPSIIEESGGSTSFAEGGAAASPLATADALATTLLERRSLVSSNKAYFETQWTRRDRTVVSYLFFAQRTLSGPVTTNRYHEAAIDYSRKTSRSSSLHTSYQYVNGEASSESVTLPNNRQTIEAGPGFAKLVGGHRQLSVSLSAGTTRVETIDDASRLPLTAWMPAGSALASLGLTRTWSVQGGYARGFSMLQGLTNELYSTGSGQLSITGRLVDGIDVTAASSLGNGRIALTSGEHDTFKLYGGTINVRFALTGGVAATATYFVYSQRYSNPAALPTGFPAHYNRNAVTVGLTFWAPLAGNMPVKPRAAGEW